MVKSCDVESSQCWDTDEIWAEWWHHHVCCQTLVLMSDLATILDLQGRHDDALVLVKQAVDLSRSAGHPDQHVLLGNMAGILLHTGEGRSKGIESEWQSLVSWPLLRCAESDSVSVVCQAGWRTRCSSTGRLWVWLERLETRRLWTRSKRDWRRWRRGGPRRGRRRRRLHRSDWLFWTKSAL